MTIRLAVTGSSGRMGTAVRETAATRDDVEVVLEASRSLGNRSDQYTDVAELESSLEARSPDVLIDFTAPDSTVEYVRSCVQLEVPVVIGTTGLESDHRESIERASEQIPVLYAANFSRGIHVMTDVIGTLVRQLTEYDIEVTETHHNAKRDAPSGTAKQLVTEIRSVRNETRQVHGRHGEALRAPDEIGVHSRRAGTVPGEHEVILAGNHEQLHLVHRAEDRAVFAVGAIDAAVWVTKRPAGWYTFSDAITEEDR